jgi:hypothetical protein
MPGFKMPSLSTGGLGKGVKFLGTGRELAANLGTGALTAGAGNLLGESTGGDDTGLFTAGGGLIGTALAAKYPGLRKQLMLSGGMATGANLLSRYRLGGTPFQIMQQKADEAKQQLLAEKAKFQEEFERQKPKLFDDGLKHFLSKVPLVGKLGQSPSADAVNEVAVAVKPLDTFLNQLHGKYSHDNV